jgi:hypothetical protein
MWGKSMSVRHIGGIFDKFVKEILAGSGLG